MTPIYRAALGRRDAQRIEDERDILRERHPRQQPNFLDHHAHLPVVRIAGDDGLAVEEHLAARRGLEAADDPEQGRLPTAVRAEDAHELSRLDAERHGVDDRDQVVLADTRDLKLHRHRVSRRATASNTSLSASIITRIITRAHTKTICVARISRL